MATAAEQKQRLVKLSSATGEIFVVAEAVALQSQFVRNVVEDVGDVEIPIPLPNVSSDVLRQVLRYCKRRHVRENDVVVDREQTSSYDAAHDFLEGPAVDAEFVEVDLKNLYDLIMAANYMHIETLLHRLYRMVAMMIANKTFGEIRQIFNFGNDIAGGGGEGEEHFIGPNKIPILASFIESLPTELQLEIKIQVGQKFHHGEWSPWQYDADAQILVVELANLYDTYNMHHQIAIILLHIDIGLVNTLILQTCWVQTISPYQSGEARIEWADQIEMELFKDLMDGIDMSKIETLIFDGETNY